MTCCSLVSAKSFLDEIFKALRLEIHPDQRSPRRTGSWRVLRDSLSLKTSFAEALHARNPSARKSRRLKQYREGFDSCGVCRYLGTLRTGFKSDSFQKTSL